MSVEIYQLRTYCAVAEEENLTRAAQKLFLSAPSASAHIKSLEEVLGVKLFTRNAKGMFLTEYGHAFWQEAEHILNQVDRLKDKLIAVSGEIAGTVRLAINNPPEIIKFDELLKALVSRYPKLMIETTFSHSSDNLQRLIAGKLDFCYFEGAFENADFEIIALERRPLILVAPKSWQVEWPTLSTSDLQHYPWVFMSEGCSCYVASQKWAHANRIELKAQIRECPNDLTTLSYVASGIGLSVIAQHALEISPYRESVEILPHFSESVQLSVAYRRDGSPLMDAVVENIRQIWGKGPHAVVYAQ